ELIVFCAHHSIPHEDCANCRPLVAAMRPTVFAELAAVELCSGTECCPECDYVYHEAVARCPQCDAPHPFHPSRHRAAASASAGPARPAVRTLLPREVLLLPLEVPAAG
ncbi:MAG TPA: hypothetical protein VIO33_09640, partial [Burkholderiaceae bacterium]